MGIEIIPIGGYNKVEGNSTAIKVDDEVQVLPSGEKNKIKKIITPSGEKDFAVKDQAVTLTFDKEIDVSRGNLICSNERHN